MHLRFINNFPRHSPWFPWIPITKRHMDTCSIYKMPLLARKVDPSDPSWISPADFVEFGSPNQWINIWSRWNRTQINRPPPPKRRRTSQRFLPKFRLKAKYYLSWIHPSVLPVIPEFVYLCSLEEIFQQNSRMGLWIAGSSWTMRVSQRSSATWTALVHTSCLALSKSDHYPWALLFKRSSTRSVQADCCQLLVVSLIDNTSFPLWVARW